MTDAQIEARKKAQEILSEHFTGYVLTVNAEQGDHEESNPTSWDGGFALAIGLAHLGIENLMESRKNVD